MAAVGRYSPEPTKARSPRSRPCAHARPESDRGSTRPTQCRSTRATVARTTNSTIVRAETKPASRTQSDPLRRKNQTPRIAARHSRTTFSGMTDARLEEDLADLERRRVRCLVEVRVEEADALHAADLQLVHPNGGVSAREAKSERCAARREQCPANRPTPPRSERRARAELCLRRGRGGRPFVAPTREGRLAIGRSS